MARNKNAQVRELSGEMQTSKLLFGDLDGLLGYRLRKAQVAMHRDYLAAVAELDLSQRQTGTLWLINANPGVSQVELASALGMDRATMMAVIDRLEERGLVIRRRSKTDRRCQELYLTPAGQTILRKVKARIAKHEERFKALFTPAELEALFAALRRIQEAS